MKKILWVAAFLISAQASSEPSIFAIYGQDDRHEIYEVTDPTVQTAARATVMLVQKDEVIQTDRYHFRLNGDVYGEALNLCPSERFWSQLRIGYCSGVLIAPDRILTAGHCVVSQEDCNETRIVFDANYTAPDRFSARVSSAKIRQCNRIIKRRNQRTGLDYAILELDRRVSDRAPAEWGPNASLRHRVFMVGHPMGLPAKYVGPAKIIGYTNLEWITDLDASPGNSGSPVFSVSQGKLVGILTGGEEVDYVDDHKCKISNRCTAASCYGELVLKAAAIRQDAGL